MGPNFDGLISFLIGIGVLGTILIFGTGYITMRLLSDGDDEIKTSKPIRYDRIELVVDEYNNIDTLYVYDVSKY